MAQEVSPTIQAKPRTPGKKGVAHRLRVSGEVPAVAYGPGFETLSLSVGSQATQPKATPFWSKLRF